ncbi:MAG: hypothetical protein KDA80_19315 [Planctomycetaceae bacterium]|nr:hypothetical protein [Planctomycetaceae bacterium]
MDRTLIGWITLTLAVLVSLLVVIEVIQGETTFKKSPHLAGERKIRRRLEPYRFWGRMLLQTLGAFGLWMLWYACWFVE